MAKLYSILAKKATIFSVLTAVLVVPLSALAQTPNDPGFKLQESMWDQINAPAAWDTTIGSNNVVVAVIDTGADIWHNDLYKNMWLNPYEIPDNGIDDDHNGYIDDVHGWNFIENNNNLHATAGTANDEVEAVSHGTVAAGLVGAMGDNETDGVGLNWKVKIMPLRALDSDGSGKYSNVIRAIDYAVDNGAQVISMSFVGEVKSPELEKSLYRAYQHGVVVVAAAGNHETRENGNMDEVPHYPACFNLDYGKPWMLAVGSVNSDDQISYFSNYGSCVSMWAPGENVVSTEWYAPEKGYATEFGGGWDGTSFATPLVAGAAALLKSVHPEWSPDQIISTLLATSDSLYVPELGKTQNVEIKRLNVGRAVAKAAATLPLPQLWRNPLYTIHDNSLWKVEPGIAEQEFIASAGGNGTLLAATVKEHDPGAYIGVLLQRSSYYYIRVLKNDGKFLNEVSLDVPKSLQKKFVPTSVEASLDIGGQLSFIVGFTNSQGKTIFAVVDNRGKVVAQHAASGTVGVWTYDDETGNLFWVETGKNQIAHRTNWQTGEDKKEILSGVVSVDDVEWEGSSLALTIRTKQDARLLQLDSDLETMQAHILGKEKKVKPRLLWPVQNSLSEERAAVPFVAQAAQSGAIFKADGSTEDGFYVPVIKGKIVH